MREAVRFLETMSDVLDIAMSEGMDSDGLPLLLEAARKDVETVRLADPSAKFEVAEGDVFWRGRPLAGTAEWDWRERLLDAGVTTLSPPDDPDAFRGWVDRLTARLGRPAVAPGGAGDETEGQTDEASPSAATAQPTEQLLVVPQPPVAKQPSTADGAVDTPAPATSEAAASAATEAPSPSRPPAGTGDREAMPDAPGAVGHPPARSEAPPAAPPTAAQQTVDLPAGAPRLDAEAERVWWLYGEGANRGQVPRRETEQLIDTLTRLSPAGPAGAEARSLDEAGELTTAHVVNVALLAIGVGRHLAFDDAEVRALALAAIYHDIGRVRLDDRNGPPPSDLEAYRAMVQRHAHEGAKVMMDSGLWFAVAAVVAYEHHLSWRGTGGYPSLHFARAPHQFTRIISVCDTYDALRTERLYRNALSAEAAADYLRILAGKTLDPEIVTGFLGYVVSNQATQIVHPRARPEVGLEELRWLPDGGFDPDCEPRPISI